MSSLEPRELGPSVSGLGVRDAIDPARVAALAGGHVDPNPHPDHIDHHDDHSAAYNEQAQPESYVQRGIANLWYYGGKAAHHAAKALKPLETPLTVKAMVRADMQKLHLYNELDLDANVRHSNDLHPEEALYLQARLRNITQYRTLAQFLNLPANEEVHPDDVPIIALGGSEGAYKAYLGFGATFEAAKENGLWDLLTYVAGVSSSCWSIAAYMTWAERSTQALLAQASATAHRHPLGSEAVEYVAHSPYGSYFLFGPLLHKANNNVPIGMLDIYGTFLTSYQWLAPPHAGVVNDQFPPFLDRSNFQWSKVFPRAGVSEGNEPFPIFTAVRDGSKEAKGTVRKSGWQWFEINPLEMGSEDLASWVPTWSFGRRFYNGTSVQRNPEQSISLILGLVASSPAAPLAEYLSNIYQTLPSNIFGDALNDVAPQSVHGSWGAGIAHQAGEPRPEPTATQPNPFVTATPDNLKVIGTIASEENIFLTDAAVAHHLPTDPLLRKDRKVDVIINVDFTTDGQEGKALDKIKAYGRERGVEFAPRSSARGPIKAVAKEGKLTAAEIQERFEGRYAEVLDGTFASISGTSVNNGVTMVYVPLLPNKIQPGFNPAAEAFSNNSFNLVWTPEQSKLLINTQKANFNEAMTTIKVVIREAYEKKKAARLNAQGFPSQSKPPGQPITPTPIIPPPTQVAPPPQPQASLPPLAPPVIAPPAPTAMPAAPAPPSPIPPPPALPPSVGKAPGPAPGGEFPMEPPPAYMDEPTASHAPPAPVAEPSEVPIVIPAPVLPGDAHKPPTV